MSVFRWAVNTATLAALADEYELICEPNANVMGMTPSVWILFHFVLNVVALFILLL